MDYADTDPSIAVPIGELPPLPRNERTVVMPQPGRSWSLAATLNEILEALQFAVTHKLIPWVAMVAMGWAIYCLALAVRTLHGEQRADEMAHAQERGQDREIQRRMMNSLDRISDQLDRMDRRYVALPPPTDYARRSRGQ